MCHAMGIYKNYKHLKIKILSEKLVKLCFLLQKKKYNNICLSLQNICIFLACYCVG